MSVRDFAGALQVVCVFLTVSLHQCQDHAWLNTDMNLFGRPGEGYYVGVQIGTPPQKFNVLVDTGSTNFAIAAAPHPNIDKYYKSAGSRSYKSRGRKVAVLYTQGNWTGVLGSDLLNFPTLKSRRVTCDIALIQTSQNFYMNGSQWQGILGLAYPLIVRPDRSVVSWLDALSDTSNASHRVTAFSLRLCGSRPFQNRHVGRLSLASERGDVAAGKLMDTPIVREWFYEVTMSGMAVGGRPVELACRELNKDKTIVDSGTTNLRLPAKVFTAVVELISTAISKHKLVFSNEFWRQQKMSCLNQDWDWNLFPNITLDLLHSDKSYFTLELTGKSYLRMAYDNVETNPHQYCYKFSIESSDTGSVLGVVAMEGFLVVFNRTAKTVGFQESHCGPPVSIYGPLATDKDLRSCLNPRDSPNLGALQTFAYIVASLLCVCAVILVYLVLRWLWKLVCGPSLSRAASEASLVSDE